MDNNSETVNRESFNKFSNATAISSDSFYGKKESQEMENEKYQKYQEMMDNTKMKLNDMKNKASDYFSQINGKWGY